MKREKILVVEDEADLREVLSYNLTREGYRVVTAEGGSEGLRKARKEVPHLVLLDLMLPDVDGLEVCRRLKKDPVTSSLPIIMVTAKGEESDVVLGLGVGADDYVTKPFRMREVVARIRALLRRVERARELAADQPALLVLADVVVDRASRRVVVAGAEVHLTPLEFDLLLALAAEPGAVRGRDDLMQEVWGWADARGTRTLDSHVKALRSKIGPERVRTVHGVGYALEAAAPPGAPE